MFQPVRQSVIRAQVADPFKLVKPAAASSLAASIAQFVPQHARQTISN